jgi:hypothetical protein
MSRFTDLVQILQMAIKALAMYTAKHPRTKAAMDRFTAEVQQWLEENPTLHIATSRDRIFLDGALVEQRNLHLTALAQQMTERQIGGLVFTRGVEGWEVDEVLQVLSMRPPRIQEQGGVAEVLARARLVHVRLSQTQYKEIKEGDDGAGEGEDDTRGPSRDAVRAGQSQEALPEPSGEALAVALAQLAGGGAKGLLQVWQEQLTALLPEPPPVPPGASMGSLQRLPAADLRSLGELVTSLGWGDGEPAPSHMDPLKRALLGLPLEGQVSIMEGLPSLPAAPTSLRMAFNALAPLVFAQSTAGLLASGQAWGDVKAKIFGILQGSSDKSTLLGALDARLRGLGMDPKYMDTLMRQLDWEGQTLEERIRRTQDPSQIWELTLEQRLAFLRSLLDEDRTETFLKILQEVLDSLHADDMERRDAGAQTLSGVVPWWVSPGLPPEAEGAILQAFSAHFGWEPVTYIHRITTASLETILDALLDAAELARAQELLEELTALCAFMAIKEPWREAALEQLREHFLSPASLKKAIDALMLMDFQTMQPIMDPYFDFIGEPAARLLITLLGEEPDRKRRARLLDMIRSMGDRALPAVLDGLHSPAWYLVRNTLNLLADMGGATATQAVEGALDHPDIRVRRTAVRALWKVGGGASVPRLLEILPASDPETQMEIMFGFSQMHAVQAVEALGLFALDKRHADRMRIKAAETLGLVGDPSAVDALAELIKRKGMIFSSAESTELRVAAARALAQIATVRSLEVLRKTVADEPRSKDHAALKQVLDHMGRPS